MFILLRQQNSVEKFAIQKFKLEMQKSLNLFLAEKNVVFFTYGTHFGLTFPLPMTNRMSFFFFSSIDERRKKTSFSFKQVSSAMTTKVEREEGTNRAEK